MSYIKNPVQVVTARLNLVIPNFQIDYPVVMGIPNSFVQQLINNRILEEVYRLINEQIDIFPDLPVQSMTMMGWYEIKTNERGLLSITIGNYNFPYHAAHGMTLIKGLTCNVQTGDFYELSDLFQEGSNYVGVLSDIIEGQINEREIPLLGDFPGIKPNHDYYLADKCLIIFFQLYEIAPYAAGILCFPISMYELQDIFKPNSPLDIMAIC